MIQGYVALAIGGLITAIMCMLVLAFGWAYRLVFDWWLKPWINNPFELAVRLWSRIMKRVVYEQLASVQFVVDGSIAPIQPDELALWVVFPHSSDLALALVFAKITELSQRVRLIVKADLPRALRWPLEAMRDVAIFIARDNADAWPAQIRNGLGKTPTGARGIVIMPETHRFNPKRLGEDIQEFAAKIPGLADYLTHTLVPHAGGLFTCRNALPHPRVRVIELTGFFDVAEWQLLHVPRICGAVFHVRLREITHDLPRDLHAMRAYLNAACKERNLYMDRMIRTQPGRPQTNRFPVCACGQPGCVHH